MTFLRDGTWLTRERVLAYARLALLAYVAAGVLLFTSAKGGLDAYGEPLGMDFHAFWAAGRQALHGNAIAAYDLHAHQLQQIRELGRAPASSYPFIYPPPFLMLMVPLALLPYAWALLLWLGSGAAVFVHCIRRIVPDPGAGLFAIAAPGFFVNAFHGQNAFFTTALLGAGVMLLESRPALAGALFGLLCMKPQIALLVPVALLAAGHWRALGVMFATAAMLACAATAAFGFDVWRAYLEATEVARTLLTLPADVYYGWVTLFEMVRLLGLGLEPALALQALATVAAAAIVGWAWHTPARAALKGAVLASATLLATPYAFVYELLVPSLGAAWLLAEGLRAGFLPYERVVIFALALMPVLTLPSATLLGLQLAPLSLVALLWLCTRRLRRELNLERTASVPT